MLITGRIDSKELEILNRLLVDHYGRGPNDLPYFRVVWGGDQFEKRIMTHTDEGLQLINPEVRTVKKYWPDLRNKYILESLTVIPEFVETDLVEELSYEPKWIFEDKYGNPLYPRWDAMRFVLETVRANIDAGHSNKAKYKDPEQSSNQEEAALARKARIDKVADELFGNETDVTDALKLKSGVVVP